MTSEVTRRVLLAQLGARRHYLVPRSLAYGGHLSAFYTDFYYGRRPWLDLAVASVLGRRAVSLKGRFHPDVPISLVVDFPSLLLAKLKGHRSDSARWLVRGIRFASAVARSGLGDADTVMAFSSAALEIFEAAAGRGVRTVLDHATAPRDRELAAVAQEEARFPGWSAAPVLDDEALPEYAQRQLRERERADRIICGSSFVAAEVVAAGADPAKVRVVPLGVRGVTAIGGPPSRERRQELHVLFVGNEGLRKGLGYLLEAVSSLRSSRIRLRIAGNPGFSKHGMSEVRRLCEDCRSVPRSEMERLYRWADVLVLPSISDTFGLVILEAMSAGVPVIASVASGGPDVIRHGVDGWIVPLRDAPAIGRQLEALATNPKLICDAGSAARERAGEFDDGRYRSRLLEAINT